MKRTHIFGLGSFFLLGLLLLISCADESYSTNPSHKLSFNENSYTFDTVFSTVGSTTATIKAYNKNNKAVSISSIYLAGGANSPFKINVSGKSSASQSFKDIYVRANDSLYVFIQITVNPTNQNSPVLIQDSIVFQLNGNTQYYLLEAYGQDVVLFKNKTIVNDTVLLNTKPYLIYGNLTLAEQKTMTIEEGTTMYFHKDAGLMIHGNFNAIGSPTAPIVLRGDRLDNIVKDEPYDAYSGLWNGITLTAEDAVHQLSFVHIRNAIFGIDISNGTLTNKPQLTIHNSRLHNFDSCAISATLVLLTMVNTELSNCGDYCLKVIGGECSIIHSTIANYYSKLQRNSASVLIANHQNNGSVLFPVTNSSIKNSIIQGNFSEELVLDNKVNGIAVGSNFALTVSNSLITGQASSDTIFSNCLWSSPAAIVFVKTDTYPFLFDLIQTSLAKDAANTSVATLYPTDKKGNSRIADGQPDIGAYEWVTP